MHRSNVWRFDEPSILSAAPLFKILNHMLPHIAEVCNRLAIELIEC